MYLTVGPCHTKARTYHQEANPIHHEVGRSLGPPCPARRWGGTKLKFERGISILDPVSCHRLALTWPEICIMP